VNRESTVAAIENAIGHRRLMWVGTRGTDAHPLLSISQFEGVVGLIAPLGVPSWPAGSEECLERLSGVRVDLDAYSVDADSSDSRIELGIRLRRALTPGTLVVSYRPSAFLASAYFPRMENATYLGMFHCHQAAYDHKPWVESELAARGVATIPWRYFSDSDSAVMLEWMEGRTCVVRANYSDGGAGLAVFDRSLSRTAIPAHDGGFFAVAPLLEPNVPLNVSGCVFPSGKVTVKSPSLQLIGLGSCTSRRFGYCGNDFASVYHVLSDEGLEELDRVVRATGSWLHGRGYVGAFGIDALLYDGRICLTEVNPRFQGSSAAASTILSAAGSSDIYLDHLCAVMSLDAPGEEMTLAEQGALQAEDGRRLTQVVCHNTGPSRRLREGVVVPDLDYGDLKATPDEGVSVLSEAMLFKLFVHREVTETGFSLPAWLESEVARLTEALYQTVEANGELGGESG